MSIKVNPPPLQVPSDLLTDRQKAAFFNSLLNTIYQLWTAVYSMQTSAKVSTTDATSTALIRTTVVDGTTVMLDCRIIARRTGGTSGANGDSAYYVLTGAYKNVGGVLTGIGAPTLTGGEDQAAWNVAFSTSGSDAVVIVQGAAGNDITWNGTLSVYEAGA